MVGTFGTVRLAVSFIEWMLIDWLLYEVSNKERKCHYETMSLCLL